MLRPNDALLAPRKTILVIAVIFASALWPLAQRSQDEYRARMFDGRGCQLINVNFGDGFREMFI